MSWVNDHIRADSITIDVEYPSDTSDKIKRFSDRKVIVTMVFGGRVCRVDLYGSNLYSSEHFFNALSTARDEFFLFGRHEVADAKGKQSTGSKDGL